MSQGELGKKLGRDTQYVYRVESGQELSIEEAKEFAKALDVLDDEIVDTGAHSRTVPLVGFVGAGDLYYPDPEAGPWVGFDVVEAPPGETGVVAVRVRGNSMAPVYRDGDLLYFAKDGRPAADFIGEDCIVQVKNGAVYIKVLAKGSRSGRFNLRSYNHETPEIANVEVEWASPIVWTKRGRRRA